MRARLLALLLIAPLGVLCSRALAAEADTLLVAVGRIPLSNAPGRFDHLAIDLIRNHLFVTEVGNNAVDVIDVRRSASIHRISGLDEPQGIVYAPAADVIVVGNGGDGSVRMFRGADFAAAGTVDLGADADNVHLDPVSGNVVVGYGDGGIAVIDPLRRVKIADISVRGHPEGFQISPRGDRVFVNVPDARQLVVVDLLTRGVAASWMQLLRANFPMAVDPAGAMLASVFRNPARLLVLDTMSGRSLSQSGTCDDADDVFFDERRHRLYVSCGDGFVDVFQQNGNVLRRMASVATSPGARTALFVPELDRLFVAARAGWFSSNAAILVFRPN